MCGIVAVIDFICVASGPRYPGGTVAKDKMFWSHNEEKGREKCLLLLELKDKSANPY